MMDSSIILGCDVCGDTDHVTENCPELMTDEEPLQLTRARSSLPNFVMLQENEDSSVSIIATETIPAKKKLGPLEAYKTSRRIQADDRFILQLFINDGATVYFDTSNEDKCNWLSLIPTAMDRQEQNLMAISIGFDIFFTTTKQIEKDTELKVWYAPHYAKKVEKSPMPDGLTKTLLGVDMREMFIDDEILESSYDEKIEHEVAESFSSPVRRSTRGGNELLSCPKCSQTFTSRPAYNVHVITHSEAPVNKDSGSENTETEISPISVRYLENIVPRECNIIHNETEDGEKKCNRCSAKFDDIKDLAKHVKEHILLEKKEGMKKRKAMMDKSFKPSKASAKSSKKASDEDPSIKKPPRGRGRPRKEVKNTGKLNIRKPIGLVKNSSPTSASAANKDESKESEDKAKISVDLDTPSGSQIPEEKKSPKDTFVQAIDLGPIFADETEHGEGHAVGTEGHTLDPERQLEAGMEEGSTGVTREGQSEVLVTDPDENNDSLEQAAEKKTANLSQADGVKEKSGEEPSGVSENSPKTEVKGHEPDGIEDSKYDNSPEVTQVVKRRVGRPAGSNTQPQKRETAIKSPRRSDRKRVIKEDPDYVQPKRKKWGFLQEEKGNEPTSTMEDTSEDETESSCLVCNKTFTRKSDVAKHNCLVKFELERAGEKEGEFWVCRICGKKFEQITSLQKHEFIHTEAFKCKKCKKAFSRKESLNKHICDADGEGGTAHFCEFCGAKFTKKQYLLRHMAAHTGEFSCQKCNKIYARKESLLSHLKVCDPETLTDKLKRFPCTQCHKVFSRSVTLLNHMKYHTGKWHCKVCEKNFTWEQSLKDHACAGRPLIETEDGMFECDQCDRKFTSKKGLWRHSLVHSGNHACAICDKAFHTPEELSIHTLECTANMEIQSNGVVVCSVCKAEFTEPVVYRKHFKRHTHPFHCDKCDSYFKRNLTLATHKCVPEIEEDLPCPTCNKVFTSMKKLTYHMIVHQEPKYSCEQCLKRFHRLSAYKNHTCIDEDGNKVRPASATSKSTEGNICPHCGKTFSSISNLNKHIICHGEKKETCNICGKMFHLKVSLKAHLKDVHTEEYKYTCPTCGKTMKSRNSMFGHMKVFHSEDTFLHECEKCGKGFRQKGNLKKHMLIHNSDKTHKCSICDKMFRFPEQKRRHELWHTDGPRFECKYCERKFVMQFELKKHIRTLHSGNVYRCEFCGTDCAHFHTLKRHLQKRHPMELSWQENPGVYIQGRLVKESTDKKPMTILQAATQGILSSDEMQEEYMGNFIESTIKEETIQTYDGQELKLETQDESITLDQEGRPLILEGQTNGVHGNGQPIFLTEVSNISSNGDGTKTQTFIIQTAGNQLPGDMMPQELAEALQNLSSRGELDASGTTIINIDMPSGDNVPVSLQGIETSQPNEEYILLPMVAQEGEGAEIPVHTE